MPPKYVTFYKKQGQTPLEVIDELKANHKDWASLPMTYAGRLDPMAEGLMIILIGEECKNKEKYLGLDKVYEFEILFGFESDTFDLLGLVKDNEQKEKIELFDSESFKETLNSFIGKQIQKYPSYSSKTVDGESLFSLAKKTRLSQKTSQIMK